MTWVHFEYPNPLVVTALGCEYILDDDLLVQPAGTTGFLLTQHVRGSWNLRNTTLSLRRLSARHLAVGMMMRYRIKHMSTELV